MFTLSLMFSATIIPFLQFFTDHNMQIPVVHLKMIAEEFDLIV